MRGAGCSDTLTAPRTGSLKHQVDKGSKQTNHGVVHVKSTSSAASQSKV
jgi:hypothetical protein